MGTVDVVESFIFAYMRLLVHAVAFSCSLTFHYNRLHRLPCKLAHMCTLKVIRNRISISRDLDRGSKVARALNENKLH